MATPIVGPGGHPASTPKPPIAPGDNNKGRDNASITGDTPVMQQYNPPLTTIKRGN